MDRLTFFDDMEGFWRLKNDRGCGNQNAIDRLAAYEDTGLEPEEVKSLKETWDLFGGEDGIQQAFMERDKYKQAESEGRLIVLPCKVGDTVWRIVGPKGHRIVRQRKVLAVTIYHTGDVIIHTDGAENRFGKTVFLTREEAEAALGGDRDG